MSFQVYTSSKKERGCLSRARNLSGKVDQHLPVFLQSTGCAVVGVMADPITSPTPKVIAMASSSFRMEILPLIE